jgi:predicted MPP superfamily phosphohydrolase
MKIRLIITAVIVIIVALLSAVHFMVYEGIILGFLIDNVRILFVLKIIFGVLSVSFISAMLIGRKYNNILTRALYYVSAVWLGFLLYFFIASVLYIVFLLIFPASILMAGFLFSVATVIGIYGVLHAANVRIKRVSISIPDIDPRWKGRKAVLVADFHLGLIYGQKYLRKIAQSITTLAPDIVFISGDIFDGMAINAREVLTPLAHLALPLGIYAVLGNHEEFSDSADFVNALRQAGIRVLLDEKVEVEGVAIVGVDYTTTVSKNDFQNVLQKIDIASTTASILLKHVPLHIDVAEKKGISLQLSGHTHQAQVFPFNLLTPIIFRGFDYGLNRSGATQVLTTSGAGTWGAPVRVGTQSEIVLITFE